MNNDLLAAMALVLIFEGMFLFASPKAWKEFVFKAMQLSNQKLRLFGGVVMVLGMGLLLLVRG